MALSQFAGGRGMAQDRQGLAITGNVASAWALDRAINDYYAWTGDILGDLSHAVEQDPEFVLGAAAIATVLQLGGCRGDDPAVIRAIATADTHAAAATRRERDHLVIAKNLAAGELRRAAQLCETILLAHPTDALALRYVTDLYYYLGDSEAIRDVVARVLPEWDEADPLFGFVLGRYAFGLEESGAFDLAEAVGRRALAVNPRDAWATHAVAHVHEMRGQTEQGLRFLEETHLDWSQGKWLAVHNGWHLALFLIEAGRGAEVAVRYDSFIEPRLRLNFILDMIDAASILWRLEIAGIDVGDRWREVAEIAAARIGEHVLAFNDLHVALGVVGAKDRAATQRLIESTDRFLTSGNGDNRTVTAEVGKPLILAMAAFREADYRRTIDLLLPLRHEIVRIGGSHAQRGLVDETLLAAAIHAEDWRLARSLLAERLARRPTARSWRLYEEVLTQLGDTAALARAQRLFEPHQVKADQP
jgi:tetratricopeptide (TPR) repeat protein